MFESTKRSSDTKISNEIEEILQDSKFRQIISTFSFDSFILHILLIFQLS